MFAQSLKRPRLQRPAIALIYAMYIALFLNIAYYRQVIALLPLIAQLDQMVDSFSHLLQLACVHVVSEASENQ